MKTEEYFQRIIDYEDKKNMYNPDQIDKNNDTEFIKMAYRTMYGMLDYHIKNLAKNYLEELKKIKNGEKN